MYEFYTGRIKTVVFRVKGSFLRENLAFCKEKGLSFGKKTVLTFRKCYLQKLNV